MISAWEALKSLGEAGDAAGAAAPALGDPHTHRRLDELLPLRQPLGALLLRGGASPYMVYTVDIDDMCYIYITQVLL